MIEEEIGLVWAYVGRMVFLSFYHYICSFLLTSLEVCYNNDDKKQSKCNKMKQNV